MSAASASGNAANNIASQHSPSYGPGYLALLAQRDTVASHQLNSSTPFNSVEFNADDLVFQNQSSAEADVFIAMDQSLENAYSDWHQLKLRTTERETLLEEMHQDAAAAAFAMSHRQQQVPYDLTPSMLLASSSPSSHEQSSENEWTAQTGKHLDSFDTFTPGDHTRSVENLLPPLIEDSTYLPSLSPPITVDSLQGQPTPTAIVLSSGVSSPSTLGAASANSTSHELPFKLTLAQESVRGNQMTNPSTAVALVVKSNLINGYLNAAVASDPALTSGQLVSKQTRKPGVAAACIACRTLKVSCDTARPCSRCVRLCRECIDRSEAEVNDAKQRKKRRRKTSTAAGDALENEHEETAAVETHEQLQQTKSIKPTTKPRWAHTDQLQPGAMLPSVPFAILTHASTSLLSAQLYSRSFLVVLQSIGVRDALMRVWGVMQSMPPQAPLQFRDQTTIMALYLTDVLTVDDFASFMTSGVTPEEQRSSTYQSFPMTRWIDVRTRPMHYVIQRYSIQQETMKDAPNLMNPAAAGLGESSSKAAHPSTAASGCSTAPLLSPYADASFTHSTHPQLVFEWLPQARNFCAMWRRLEKAKEDFDRQLRECKAIPQGEQGIVETTMEEIRAGSSSSCEDHRDTPMASSNAIDPLRAPNAMCVPGNDVPLSEADTEKTGTIISAPFIHGRDDSIQSQNRSVTNETESITALANSINCLAVGIVDENPPNPSGPGEPPVQLGHAKWCKMSDPSLLQMEMVSGSEYGSAKKAQKKPRKEGAQDVYADRTPVTSSSSGAASASSTVSLSTSSCNCERSLPLPVRVSINSAFTRLFGYTQEEMNRGMCAEQMQFLRHLYPPSVWPAIQMTTATQMLGFAHASSLAAAGQTASPGPVSPPPFASPPAPNHPPRPPSNLMHTQIVTRVGAIFPALVAKRTLPGVESMAHGHIMMWEAKPLQPSSHAQ